ncbi:unnamed protein product [Rhizoctonia solani]|uniref:RING-type domain-containing protein n=1 Tax=Rhizoctonia solani TaxID=456999 RepID=A0A8H2X9C0_9AGAM|nr:unnamed protein product [Rhizoctonia solani]
MLTATSARTRRMQLAPFLTQAEGNNGATQTQPPGSVAIDMSSAEPKDKESRSESLFGPPIPPSAIQDSQSTQPRDEVSETVVNDWGDEPATTLQALVNLKRPSLRLTPLASNASNTDLGSNTKASHGLEFDYDCDAAKCRITVTMTPNEHNKSESESEGKDEPITIFETVTEGGFGRTLKHEHGAILDLVHHDETKETDASATEDAPAPESVALPTESVPAPTRSRRRISVPFHIRRRDRGPQQTAGPALPVVDADANNTAEGSKDNAPKEAGGVDVTIQLDALDEAGELTTPRNSQVTLLHVVKLGQPPADGAEDTRSWVVRVVRRDALIGNHTFRLHEIYGLASANAPTPAAQTYPPPAVTDHEGEALPDAHAQRQTYEFAGAECVLCLSSPREVMLLPCRHLVACKECAENMITFGAGEGVSAPAPAPAPAPAAEETTPANANANTNEPSAGAPNANANATPEPLTPFQAAAATGRRKRKAKGWFCPVCRQPYTSLLRISMQPLNVKPEEPSAPAEQAQQQQPAAEPEQQMQSKGPLSGMVSMARGVLTRKQTAEAAPAGGAEATAATAGQSTTAATSPTNNP